MSKSKWKKVSVQDCGCVNQQRHAFSTQPVNPGEKITMRTLPCAEHRPHFLVFIDEASNFEDNYFDNFVDGRGF